MIYASACRLVYRDPATLADVYEVLKLRSDSYGQGCLMARRIWDPAREGPARATPVGGRCGPVFRAAVRWDCATRECMLSVGARPLASPRADRHMGRRVDSNR